MAENDIQHNVAEMCLAHRVGSDVEIAYNRSNLLDKRRIAMQKWCDYVDNCRAEAHDKIRKELTKQS